MSTLLTVSSPLLCGFVLVRSIFSSGVRTPAAPECRSTSSPHVESRLRDLIAESRRRSESASVRRVIGVALGLFLVEPFMTAVFLGASASWRVFRRRAAARTDEHERSGAVGDMIDLYAIALLNGHNATNATRQVSRWIGGEAGAAMDWCCRQVDHGRRLADVLEELPNRLHPSVRPLSAALIAHERYGSPIGQTLVQLANDHRGSNRRKAEAAARRLPIALLFPLVFCVLPAFMLLTVAPVVANSLTSFQL